MANLRQLSLPPIPISGTLVLPSKHDSKMPAVVMMHGSAGVTDREFSLWGTLLNEMGIAAFIVDSFTPRGIKETTHDQSQVSDFAGVADAFSALQVLAARQDIDPNRIGVMGFSKGGIVSLQTIWEPFRRGIISDNLRFAAHIPFFPSCIRQTWSKSISTAPVLLLVGEKDDYTHAEPCVQYAERIQQLGGNSQTIVYPNAYHGFEAEPGSFVWGPKVQTFSTCPTVEAEIGEWRWHRAQPIENDPNESNYNFGKMKCWSYGAHSGNHPASNAREQSQKDVKVFLTKTFSITINKNP